MRNVKIGDSVLCVKNNGSFKKNNMYKVVDVNYEYGLLVSAGTESIRLWFPFECKSFLAIPKKNTVRYFYFCSLSVSGFKKNCFGTVEFSVDEELIISVIINRLVGDVAKGLNASPSDIHLLSINSFNRL